MSPGPSSGPTLPICESAQPPRPAIPEPEREGEQVDPRRADPEARARCAVLGHRAHQQPEAGAVQEEPDAGSDQR